MDARLQDAYQNEYAEQQVGRPTGDAQKIQGNEYDNPEAGKYQRHRRQLGSIEERNNDDRAKVVDDRQRQQEYLERWRRPRPQQGQHAEREGDVGRGGNGPATKGFLIAPVAGEVDESRAGHAPKAATT